jgi:hypothetical protein
MNKFCYKNAAKAIVTSCEARFFVMSIEFSLKEMTYEVGMRVGKMQIYLHFRSPCTNFVPVKNRKHEQTD